MLEELGIARREADLLKAVSPQLDNLERTDGVHSAELVVERMGDFTTTGTGSGFAKSFAFVN